MASKAAAETLSSFTVPTYFSSMTFFISRYFMAWL